MITIRPVNPFHPKGVQYELNVEEEVGTLEELKSWVTQALEVLS